LAWTLAPSYPDLLIATVQNLRKLLKHFAQTDPELLCYPLQLLRELNALFLSRSAAILLS